MPEGDTIFAAATVLRLALAGRTVTGLDLVAPRVTQAAARRRIVGGTVKAVESNGKHLLMTFGTDGEDVVLHTHMKMTGSWHVYRTGERWRAAPSRARAVVRTDEYVAPCFDPPVVELLAAREIADHPVLPALGPDVIRDAFDEDEAVRRLRLLPERDIATALLDQRALSGIGNEFKNEALFQARLWPWTPVGDLSDAALRGVVRTARDLMRRNRRGGPRRTRFVLDRRQLRSVQERGGKPCVRCGTPIARGTHGGEDVRASWWCPRCQAAPAP